MTERLVKVGKGDSSYVVLMELTDDEYSEYFRHENDNEDTAGNRPSLNTNKAEWVEYAVARGADPGEANALTKAQLIELYGEE